MIYRLRDIKGKLLFDMKYLSILPTLLAVTLAACGLYACSDAEDSPAISTPGTAESLVGTTWRLEDYTITFHEPPEIHVAGGKIDEDHPEGVVGEYSVENGIIDISALDQGRSGTWDGQRLVIDGEKARRR